MSPAAFAQETQIVSVHPLFTFIGAVIEKGNIPAIVSLPGA
jgi:hypothetical protein